jgi:hypothetical protein
MLETYTLVIAGIGMVLFLLGQQALLIGLIISSVLQAMAFVNINSSPIIVYYFFGVLLTLRAGLDLLLNPKQIWWVPGQNAPVLWLGAFTSLALLGSFLLPLLFAGMLVYSPKFGLDDQLNNMTPLALGASHLNQAAQLLINFWIFYIIWLRRISPAVLTKAILAGFGVAIFFALWQFLANATDIYFPEEWLYTVDGWSLGSQQVLGSFKRVNGSFLEPSLLSTYLIGMFSFLLILWMKQPSLIRSFGVFLTLLVMLITTSSTAYLGLLLVILFVLLVFGFAQLRDGARISKALMIIFILIVMVIFLSVLAASVSSEVADLFNLILFEKSEGDSFGVRFEADIQSARILWESYGLGVGLGSNRPSSFLMFLLSNVGLLGCLLLFTFIFSLSQMALQHTKQLSTGSFADWGSAAVWGLWTTIIAKMASQPDLSFSPMWVWVFLLASLCTFKPVAKASIANP